MARAQSVTQNAHQKHEISLVAGWTDRLSTTHGREVKAGRHRAVVGMLS